MHKVEKKCFVIIGFGPKKDLETGRILDLDKTFENLIKPVFTSLKIDCFRAKDIRHTGIIDVPMYEWIYNADIVVADISTLNPNTLYELGVRHALKPYSTIVISEKDLKYPFDINHTIIEPYEHLGIDIGVSEAKRFKKILKDKIKNILETQKNDSPVYTYLPKLKPPSFREGITKTGESDDKSGVTPSLSEFLQDAEKAKNNEQFTIAAELYKVCLRFEPNNVFLKQRLAFVTYKSKNPNPRLALLEAEKILKDLNPDITIDTETLGLLGAINKRLHEITSKDKYLNKAIWFYERGYYIQQDYYTGINFAYQLTIKASLTENKLEAFSYYLQANRVRQKVIEICLKLSKNHEFNERGDQEWVFQSLAQAYLGLGQEDKLKRLIPKIKRLSKGSFDLNTFQEQNKKLVDAIKKFIERHQL